MNRRRLNPADPGSGRLNQADDMGENTGGATWRVAKAMASGVIHYYANQARMHGKDHQWWMKIKSNQYSWTSDPIFKLYRQNYGIKGETEQQTAKRYVKTQWSYDQRLAKTKDFWDWKQAQERNYMNSHQGATTTAGTQYWVDTYKKSDAVKKNKYYDESWHTPLSARDQRAYNSPGMKAWLARQPPSSTAGMKPMRLLFDYEEGKGVQAPPPSKNKPSSHDTDPQPKQPDTLQSWWKQNYPNTPLPQAERNPSGYNAAALEWAYATGRMTKPKDGKYRRFEDDYDAAHKKDNTLTREQYRKTWADNNKPADPKQPDPKKPDPKPGQIIFNENQ